MKQQIIKNVQTGPVYGNEKVNITEFLEMEKVNVKINTQQMG